ncbi:MAG TPA: protein kinase, partial [Polyangiaceae bacterium]
MAAFSTPDPKADARGQKPAERLRLLRPLGARSFPAWAALDESAEGGARLVVADRAQRREFDDGDIADWIRDARRLEALDHPNIARVRGVLIRSHEILVVTEFVDGVRWKELAASVPAPPLETALRIFVDVLSGLNALHNLRDAKRQPVKLVHGVLTPESIVVGIDGVAKLLGSAGGVSTGGARTTPRSRSCRRARTVSPNAARTAEATSVAAGSLGPAMRRSSAAIADAEAKRFAGSAESARLTTCSSCAAHGADAGIVTAGDRPLRSCVTMADGWRSGRNGLPLRASQSITPTLYVSALASAESSSRRTSGARYAFPSPARAAAARGRAEP